MQKGGGKKRQRVKKNSRKGTKTNRDFILDTILRGDTTIVEAFFFRMFGNGKFPQIRKHVPSSLIKPLVVEDIKNDVYIVIAQKRKNDTLHQIKYPKSYVWSLTRNLTLKHEKDLKKWVRVDVSESHIDMGTLKQTIPFHQLMIEENSMTELVRFEQELALDKAINTLKENEKEMILLRYEESASNKKIGETFGISANNVAVRNRNSRLKLREQLQDMVHPVS